MFYATNYAEGISTPEEMLVRIQTLTPRIQTGDLVINKKAVVKQLLDADPRTQEFELRIREKNDRMMKTQAKFMDLEAKLATLSGGRRRRRATRRRRSTKRRQSRRR